MFIPDPDLDVPIPDPGVKKAPDPGSGSATLGIHNKNLERTPIQFFTDVVLRRRSGLPPSWRRRSLTGSGLRERRRTTSVRGSGSSALPLSSPRQRHTHSLNPDPVFRIRNCSQFHFADYLYYWTVAKASPPPLFCRCDKLQLLSFFLREGG